jgi:hypothetical protein
MSRADRVDNIVLLTMLALVAFLALAGCGLNPKRPDTTIGDKAIAVSCVPPGTPDLPPNLPTKAQLAAMDGPTRFIAATDGYLALLRWSLGVEPVISACRLAP